MKTALVTGSAGFVGRHMVAELDARGWEVLGCDVIARDGRGHVDALKRFTTDRTLYDLVVHAAARSPHRAAIDGEPTSHLHNQLLDAALFDWAVRTRQCRVLYLSSAAVYPVGFQAGHQPYRLREDDADPDQPVSAGLLAAIGQFAPLRPDASYGWTKATGEQLAASARAAGLAVTVVRPFSGYGEDQGTDWPFGAFVDRARRWEDPFEIWGSGAQVRDWIHIDDVVAGALAVVESGTEEPVNLCTGVGTSMAQLALLMTEAAGYRSTFRTLPDKPAGVAYRVGDPHRMLSYYMPRVSIVEGVRRAIKDGG